MTGVPVGSGVLVLNRMTVDEMLMHVANIIAARGTCNRKSVGAVIARDTRVVSTGYVGSPPGHSHCLDVGCLIDEATGGCIRTQHAEANSIAFAARHGIATEGCSLYTTLSPCLPCAKLILAAGITMVRYEVEYRDTTGVEYLRNAGVSCEEI